MIIGFVGTYIGMTYCQIYNLHFLFRDLKPTGFVHGGEIGADSQAHEEVMKFLSEGDIEIYPVNKDRLSYWQDHYPKSITHFPSEPLSRNQIIVHRCNLLLACPTNHRETPESRSWATVRYAEQVGRAHTIIYPDMRGGYA